MTATQSTSRWEVCKKATPVKYVHRRGKKSSANHRVRKKRKGKKKEKEEENQRVATNRPLCPM